MKTKLGKIVVGSLSFVMWGCSQSDQPTTEHSSPTNRVTRVPATTLPVTTAGGYTNPAVIPTNSSGGGMIIGTAQTNAGVAMQQPNEGRQIIAGTLSGDQGETEIDLGIVQRIRKSLETDKDLGPIAGKIRIGCANGEVTLSGTVPDQLTKMAVTDKVKSVTGVKGVDNRLDVGS